MILICTFRTEVTKLHSVENVESACPPLAHLPLSIHIPTPHHQPHPAQPSPLLAQKSSGGAMTPNIAPVHHLTPVSPLQGILKKHTPPLTVAAQASSHIGGRPSDPRLAARRESVGASPTAPVALSSTIMSPAGLISGSR